MNKNFITFAWVALLCLGLTFCGGRGKKSVSFDIDGDGIENSLDNCTDVANEEQENSDKEWAG